MEIAFDFKQYILPIMIGLFLISAIVTLIVAMLLNFHWKEFGQGHPEVKALKTYFITGSIVILILMILSVVLYG